MKSALPAETPGASATTGAGADLCSMLNLVLGDLIELYVKTRHFLWHASVPGLWGARPLLDEQGAEVLAAINDIVRRVRQFGGEASPSISEPIGLLRSTKKGRRVLQMLSELYSGNLYLAVRLRAAFDWFHERGDAGTARMIETWIDEAERRLSVLLEALGKAPAFERRCH